MNKICSVILCYNAAKYDYCYLQAIESLLACTDYCIVVAGGQDETVKTISDIQNDNLEVIEISEREWDTFQGKEKLNYFQNAGMQLADQMGFQYILLGQADEVYDPRSYRAIRQAVEAGHEGYLCRRSNLWQDAFHVLKVAENRQPCSTKVIRLAKVNYRSYDDGENINVQANSDFADRIHIWHYGFVRDRKIMKDKVINMQENVFNMGSHDTKLDGADEFIPSRWFGAEDLELINEPHPEIMKDWIKDRP